MTRARSHGPRVLSGDRAVQVDEVPVAEVLRDPLLDRDLLAQEGDERPGGVDAGLLELGALLRGRGRRKEELQVAQRAARPVGQVVVDDAAVAGGLLTGLAGQWQGYRQADAADRFVRRAVALALTFVLSCYLLVWLAQMVYPELRARI